MSDPTPKLRVIDDQAEPEAKAGVVRLKAAGTSFEPVERLAPEEAPVPLERLETQTRESFDGRTHEPGVEAILDQAITPEAVEQPWGKREGTFGGIPYGWFVLILLALVGAGVWAFLQVQQGEKVVALKLDEVRVQNEDDAAKDREARQFVETVERTVKVYLAADTLEKVLPLVRHPERVKPLIEAEWKVRPKLPLKFSRLTSFHPATISGGTFWILRAEVRDGAPQNLLVEQIGDDQVRVDWETHVCYQPMDWDRYIQERPSGEALEFRIWAVPDTHYSHEFSNTGRWRCYRLGVKDHDDHLFGYAPAGSEEARILDEYCLHSPNGTATAILRLRFPAGARSPRGVVIEKFVEPRWMRVTDPSKDGP